MGNDRTPAPLRRQGPITCRRPRIQRSLETRRPEMDPCLRRGTADMTRAGASLLRPFLLLDKCRTVAVLDVHAAHAAHAAAAHGHRGLVVGRVGSARSGGTQYRTSGGGGRRDWD